MRRRMRALARVETGFGRASINRENGRRYIGIRMNVPFALMGGVFGLYLAGMPLSFAAAVGFIALIGQAALNGLLVMSAIAERRAAGEALDEGILNGAQERPRPVLMTAALAALGLVPACLSRGIGSETQKLLAVVIVAGTLSACALTLVLLPVMYRLFTQYTERLVDKMPVRLLRAVPAAETLRKTGS